VLRDVLFAPGLGAKLEHCACRPLGGMQAVAPAHPPRQAPAGPGSTRTVRHFCGGEPPSGYFSPPAPGYTIVIHDTKVIHA
jgi:hypothetical protein